MATHLRRADSALVAAISALDAAVIALPVSAIAPLGAVLDAVREARGHLACIDSADVERYLSVETCQSLVRRGVRCGAPAAIDDCGEGYCATHVCVDCRARGAQRADSRCAGCDLASEGRAA